MRGCCLLMLTWSFFLSVLPLFIPRLDALSSSSVRRCSTTRRVNVVALLCAWETGRRFWPIPCCRSREDLWLAVGQSTARRHTQLRSDPSSASIIMCWRNSMQQSLEKRKEKDKKNQFICILFLIFFLSLSFSLSLARSLNLFLSQFQQRLQLCFGYNFF